MKNLLTLGFLISGALVSAQSFEWNDEPAKTTTHPKEVVVASNEYDKAYNERQTGMAGIYAPNDEGSRTAYGETYRGTEMTGSHAVLPLGTLLRVTNPNNGRTVVVRVTDRGRECAGCLITLSASAAAELGIEGQGAIDLERSGFSNWNPIVPSAADRKPATDSSPAIVRREAVPGGIVAPKAKVNSATETVPKPSVFTREVSSEAVAYQSVVSTPPPTVRGMQQARGSGTAPSETIPAPAKTVTPVAGQYSVQLAAYSNEEYAQRRIVDLKEKGLTDVFYRSVTKPDGQVINRVYAGNYASADDAQQAVRSIQGRYDLAGIVAKM